MKLEAIEDDFPAIKQIDASYHKQKMTVEYDETKLTVDEIIAAGKNKGYQAIPA